MQKTRKVGRRQSARRLTLIVTFLAFPVVLNYLSPYVIVDAAARGIVNGSLLVFVSLFALSLFFGRVWCGWACPAAGLQEFAAGVVGRPVGRRARRVKWFIWFPWLAAIVLLAVRAGGYRSFEPLYLTEAGISVAEPLSYVTYYMVLALILVPGFLAGRRAFCHSLCWMAPFMIVGRRLRNAAGWAALRLKGDSGRCTECRLCTSACPMSLPVTDMVQAGLMENAECIHCGTCVDTCQQGAIRFSFSRGVR